MRMCAYSFYIIIDESMPFYGLISLFRAIGIKEAQGARTTQCKTNSAPKMAFLSPGTVANTVAGM